MSKNAFDKIAAGLEDALAFVKGDESRGVVHQAVDIKALRKVTGKTQDQFAAVYHLPVGTVRDWEQGRRVPDAPARALLSMIAKEPETVARLLAG
ncbi:transcriptional regulator [Sphingobium sufflavum]|uniref:helix-turn-helix domain-containing protein n=1 Tax=Sphingobium sufflavum TaxID=1129547 RepID=UPI001F2DBAB8|nr:transcriptional regulator [Sphingobium sufflavum]MCE7798261.1 transcriptional regulator [Sphingobium sufflavum]